MIIENKHKFLPLNLQFFAEDPSPVDPPADPPNGGGEEKTPEEIALEKKIEAESDRKLASAKVKWEKEQEARTQQLIKDALAEKERLSKLSEKERKEEELSQREKDLQKRLADIERKELKADAISDLSEKGLPSDFADFLLAEDAEKTLVNINEFKTAFDAAVNEKVKEALRQETPKAGGGSPSSNKMPSVADLAQKHRLIKQEELQLW